MVPTSTSRQPDSAMISGTRKPPPISTSSPRDTTTSRPRAERGERQQHRRGVVVHDQPRLGAARAREQRACVSVARPAPAGRQIELQVRVRAADGVRRRPSASAPTGARPRLVCSSTPVAFTTGRSRAPCWPLDPARRVTDDGFLVDVAAGRDRRPGVGDRVPRRVGEQRVREAGEPARRSGRPREGHAGGP